MQICGSRHAAGLKTRKLGERVCVATRSKCGSAGQHSAGCLCAECPATGGRGVHIVRTACAQCTGLTSLRTKAACIALLSLPAGHVRGKHGHAPAQQPDPLHWHSSARCLSCPGRSESHAGKGPRVPPAGHLSQLMLAGARACTVGVGRAGRVHADAARRLRCRHPGRQLGGGVRSAPGQVRHRVRRHAAWEGCRGVCELCSPC
jgi:hypothetical protein